MVLEVNKDAAEQCRDMGAAALRNRQFPRAVKLLNKSLNLYPLPGVKALLSQAERKLAESESSASSSNNNNASSPRATARPTSTAAANGTNTANNVNNGRSYTPEQVKIVEDILKAKTSTQHSTKPHYRILGIPENANEAQIKKAYRKLAVKVHPDKNSAPQADEAFKAVGLAYATLSDSEKRNIYDRFGEEDPDNRGGGGAAAHMRRRGGGGFRPGEEVSPEDIFNMFFGGGGMGGGMGGPGVRMYTNGNGFQFNNMRQQPRRQQQRGAGNQQEQEHPQNPFNQILQILPLLLLMFLSFFNFDSTGVGTSTGGVATANGFFSLTHQHPHVNPLQTRLVTVKDIPFFVSDKFMRTYARDRYQLAQVERMVEKTYEKYLRQECKTQQTYKATLQHNAAVYKHKRHTNGDTQQQSEATMEAERERQLKKASEFQLTRCDELENLFGSVYRNQRR